MLVIIKSLWPPNFPDKHWDIIAAQTGSAHPAVFSICMEEQQTACPSIPQKSKHELVNMLAQFGLPGCATCNPPDFTPQWISEQLQALTPHAQVTMQFALLCHPWHTWAG